MSCITCQKSKALLKCGLCDSDVCKYCAILLPDGGFSFLAQIPEDLNHTTYCNPCFVTKVSDQWDEYKDTIEKAKNINVYLSNQGKETRLIKRTEDMIYVKECDDHDETLLRLAFFAVQKGFNGLVDVELTSAKVRTNNYQTLVWSGAGRPANISERTLIKDKSFWHNPS